MVYYNFTTVLLLSAPLALYSAKVNAETWEHGKIAKNRSNMGQKHKQWDAQTGFQQANRLVKLIYKRKANNKMIKQSVRYLSSFCVSVWTYLSEISHFLEFL